MEKVVKECPLSSNQMGIYLECINNEETLQYNIGFEYIFESKIDPQRLKNATDKVLANYAAFRSAVIQRNGEPRLITLPEAPTASLHTITESEYQQIKSHFVSPFVLDGQPLCRVNIYKTENATYMLFEIHHLVYDGLSTLVFEHALELAYKGEEIPTENYSVYEATQDDQKLAESDKMKESYNYFEKLLEGVETDSNILPDLDGSDTRHCHSAHCEMGVSAQCVKEMAKANGVTENVLLLAAFSYTLAKFSGQKESLFTSINSGRRGRPLENTIGFFVRTFPLYFKFDEDSTISDYIQYTKKNYFDTMSHDDVPFAELASKYGIRSDIKYVYQGDLINDVKFDGTTLKKTFFDCDDAMSNLDVMITRVDDKYHLKLDYRRGLYSEENIMCFAKMYSCVVKSFLKEKHLKDIQFVSDETQSFIEKFNATEKPYNQDETVWDIVSKQIKASPEKTAISFKDKTITYADFDKLTSKIASYLTNKGIGKEDFVSILIPRNEFIAVTAFGVVRSGAAYQPLDPTYPQERLNFMVKDSGAKLLIADRDLRHLLNEYEGEVLYTDEIENLPFDEDFQPKDSPKSALVIIYTSGTTGTPKGCVLENRNIVCFHHNHVKNVGLEQSSCVATYASFGFDAGIMDIFTTLMVGATLHVLPDEIRLDITQINDFYKKNKITHGFITTQVGRMFAETTDCQTLKTMLVGGEKLVPFNPPTNFAFVNGYGPSETIAYVCHHRVTDNSPVQPIGKPSDNTKLYVADSQMRMLPAGACGELCVAGGQVGREYLNRPEKTAESFVENPFCNDKYYNRIYKTGDVVRLLPSGEIDFVGRRDGQVKIRGFRVELTEIEEVIRRFENVKDATVVAFDEKNGGKYIAAYIAADTKIDISNLKKFIADEKPPYMVPAVIMQIDAIPYTQNQKVNKRALPVPKREIDTTLLEKPKNETQQKIFNIAKDILGHEEFGVTSNLFEVGMTSIGTIRFNVQLGKTFDKAIKLSDIKEHNTIEKLEAFLTTSEAQKTYQKQADYPLMQNQMGVFVEMGIDSSSLDYNIPLMMKLSDKIDTAKLQKAVCTAIDAHPYIKTTLKADKSGNARAIRQDDCKCEVDIIKTDTLPKTTDLVRPFNLMGGKLYRVEIYETNNGNYLFIDVHHIVSDGTSLAILLNDINLAYKGEKIDTEIFTGFEAALEEEQLRSSEKYETSKNYFDTLLNGCNTECMPAKCAEPNAKEGDCTIYDYSLGKKSAEIIAYCQKNNITMNAFFNAVFSHVLATFLHADDVTYCTVYNGRNDSRLANSFSMLVKTLPVHGLLMPESSVLDYIQSVQQQLIETMSNDVVSFAEISNKYGVKPNIFFNYQGDNFEFDNIGGEKAEIVPLDFAAAKAPLSVELFLEKDNFSVKTTYRTDCLCREFISSFVGALATAAADFVKCEKIKQVSLLSDEEHQHFDEMNTTDRPFENIAPQKFFERCAKATPERTAVKTRNESLTFKELDEKANSVANSLVKLGVKSDEIVGLLLDRSAFVPMGELGILKAGGAFLPMLPTYPDERLDFCMQNADCRFVITTKDIIDTRKELFSADKNYRALDIETLVAESEKNTPDVKFSQSQLAYCIYTSGSTGTPKGVMIEHHNLANIIQSSEFVEFISKGTTELCMASISFDMSITEIFDPLCHGKTIYIASEEEIHNLDMMLAAFTEHKIDMMTMTPSFAWTLLSLPAFGKALSQLQSIILGAEAFQPVLFDKLKSLNPDMLIMNGYGPTECTQACSFKTITDGKNITIGGPLTNSKYYTMDNYGNLLPRYAVGELIICGEGVGRGYVKLPEKNAASFIEVEGVRAYHSGDLVRINRNNEAEFGGRADNQVKLRGFRIELDEVENVMMEFKGVSQAKVIVRNNGTEDFLAGFFTADKETSVEELSTFMRKKLTYYMVPAAMMQLDKMPMTANGKLDKKALPEIRPVKKEKVKRVPKKSLEEKILDIFRSVLKQDECYVDDNFFEIGGTSLSASNVVMQLKSEGYKVEYQDIFDHQTAENLAEYIESQQTKTAPTAQTDTAQNQYGETIEELKYNTLEYAAEVERKPLGDVLLTGATGFLGNHILKDLIENESGHIYCLLRKGGFDDILARLKSTLFYYFEDNFDEAFKSRITLIEGDITDDGLATKITNISFDTIINCAACVKHFANDNSIEFVNVHGVQNLIAIAKEKNAKMIQISTTSVPGVHTEETYKINLRMTEDKLFVVDDMNNQYGQSKYKAELLMLEAIKDGMRGKIIRVGNLMGRSTDGEFQTNLHANAFLNGLRGFAAIGKCPISHSTDPMSFSAIDSTAHAVVLLSGTNDKFTAFNADSRFIFDEMKLIDTCNRCGITITPVKDEEYYADFYRMMGDPKTNERVSALLTNDRPGVHMVNTDNRFTANILYRLGFAWPFVDDSYLEKVIEALDGMGFFWE